MANRVPLPYDLMRLRLGPSTTPCGLTNDGQISATKPLACNVIRQAGKELAREATITTSDALAETGRGVHPAALENGEELGGMAVLGQTTDNSGQPDSQADAQPPARSDDAAPRAPASPTPGWVKTSTRARANGRLGR